MKCDSRHHWQDEEEGIPSGLHLPGWVKVVDEQGNVFNFCSIDHVSGEMNSRVVDTETFKEAYEATKGKDVENADSSEESVGA